MLKIVQWVEAFEGHQVSKMFDRTPDFESDGEGFIQTKIINRDIEEPIRKDL